MALPTDQTAAVLRLKLDSGSSVLQAKVGVRVANAAARVVCELVREDGSALKASVLGRGSLGLGTTSGIDDEGTLSLLATTVLEAPALVSVQCGS